MTIHAVFRFDEGAVTFGRSGASDAQTGLKMFPAPARVALSDGNRNGYHHRLADHTQARRAPG